jgi:hypothetical protein
MTTVNDRTPTKDLEVEVREPGLVHQGSLGSVRSRCSGCFRLERLPGGTYTHWKAPPFHGAHPTRTLAVAQEQHPVL